MKLRRIARESGENITVDIKDIERMFGSKVADALVEYCRKYKKDIDKVMNSLEMDGNRQNEWDKFDAWLQDTKKIDFTGGFGDYDIDAEIDRERKRKETVDMDVDDFEGKMEKIRRGFGDGKQQKRRYVSRNRFKESLGEHNTELDVIDSIAECIGDHDAVDSFEYDDYEPYLYLTMTDGTKFKVSVEKIESSDED